MQIGLGVFKMAHASRHHHGNLGRCILINYHFAYNSWCYYVGHLALTLANSIAHQWPPKEEKNMIDEWYGGKCVAQSMFAKRCSSNDVVICIFMVGRLYLSVLNVHVWVMVTTLPFIVLTHLHVSDHCAGDTPLGPHRSSLFHWIT